jgi:dephospho-CoA kinase
VIVVGLTGGIGTGKSTVARLLRERGVPVIDADQVSREVVAPGQPTLDAIVEAFGPAVLGTDGALDRARMRTRIAHDPAERRRLEALTHPAIRRRIEELLGALASSGTTHAVVEAALMVETGSYRQYPVLVVVTCEPTRQLARVMERDRLPVDSARALIAAQLPLADKERLAHHVIRNDGDLVDLARQVDSVWDRIAADGAGPGPRQP